ncbi:DgyrCDS14217 [Dimorphilus gyrociliatus]|uniref:DNA damage-binding protein 1 n=1 Tax=Dimorphilus gyrociliatus TaxID=2664684 RepID=A0A7I8WD03_9ANNE|nr:DgyrCDS14217 [Dimorphilus gyrociliatus]
MAGYMVLAKPPSLVSVATTGHFTAKNGINLVIAKNSIVEIFELTPEGLKLRKEFKVFGSVAAMKMMLPPGCEKDVLFIVTEKGDITMLECTEDGDELSINTLCSKNVLRKTGRLTECGFKCCVDQYCRYIVVHIYYGLLTIIPVSNVGVNGLNASGTWNSTNVIVDEMEILDLCSLYVEDTPTISLLFREDGSYYVGTYEIEEMTEDEYIITEGPGKRHKVDDGAQFIVPVPCPIGGMLVLGDDNQTIRAVEMVDADGKRFLVGDSFGHLYILILVADPTSATGIREIQVELLGETNIPSLITYLDNGFIFIGSCSGDAQLIRLNRKKNAVTNSYVEVMENFDNLGPIVDFVAVDVDDMGQEQLICCSGRDKNGSLRIVRNDMEIKDIGTVELPGILGVWAVSLFSSGSFDDSLFVTFPDETKIILITEEMEEITVPGFDHKVRTLHVHEVIEDQIIQITRKNLILWSSTMRKQVFQWKFEQDKNISVGTSNREQIVIASAAQFVYFEIIDGSAQKINSLEIEYEIACMDVTPRGTSNRTNILCLGVWTDMSIFIFELPTLEKLFYYKLPGNIIPRSILTGVFGDVHYLFIAMGDGKLYHFLLNKDKASLHNRVMLTLGSLPLQMSKFSWKGTDCVFVCSDRPAVAFPVNHQLIFSFVNISTVRHMTSAILRNNREKIYLVNETELLIGEMNEMQRLQSRVIPLRESPRKIAYQPETNTLAVLTSRYDKQKKGTEETILLDQSASTSDVKSRSSFVEVGPFPLPLFEDDSLIEIYNLLIMHQDSFEIFHIHQFQPHEYALSLCNANLGDHPEQYFVVSTGIIRPGDDEPRYGRIMVFKISLGRAVIRSCLDITGAVYAIQPLLNNKLVCCFDDATRIYELDDRMNMNLINTFSDNIAAYNIAVTERNRIYVGDLFRTITILDYIPEKKRLRLVGRDDNHRWLCTLTLINENTIICADQAQNLFICTRDDKEPDESSLKNDAFCHIGDTINAIKPGCLVKKELLNRTICFSDMRIFVTTSGAIGVIVQLKDEYQTLFYQLQQQLLQRLNWPGKIDYKWFRSNSKPNLRYHGLVDGTIVEKYLTIPSSLQKEIFHAIAAEKEVTVPVVDHNHLIRLVEEISSIY